ncbi:LEA14-like protein [Dioscorea alata]|uniref:LEA14-like protein n=1 Tax=Dioscorea alata TaxID=55571 RepID=A0ACB7WPN6_DIOAL|nr:LEA14-like protein [Dioscorea alata]
MVHLMGKAKKLMAEKIAKRKKPEADVDNVSLHNISRKAAIFNATISIHNPYSHDLPICEIYTVKSADRVVVSGKMEDLGSIKAEKNTKVDVPLKVPYDSLISLMKEVGRDWDVDYELCLGLTVDIPIFGNFTIPLSKKGELKLPTLSDIF